MATKWVVDLVLISVKLKNIFCGGQGESIATSVAEYLTVLLETKKKRYVHRKWTMNCKGKLSLRRAAIDIVFGLRLEHRC